MKRPNPESSLSRADAYLVKRKVAACGLEEEAPWGSAGVNFRPIDAARVFTSGTELDPRDLVACASNMVAALFASLEQIPPDQYPNAITGILMDAIAQGYHARTLEQAPAEASA